MTVAGTYWNDMTPIPFWVTEVNECYNGNKEVETKFENLEIGSSHGRMKGRDNVRDGIYFWIIPNSSGTLTAKAK